VDKSGVADVVEAARRVDTSDPELAKLPFSLLSIPVGIDQAALHLLFGFAEMFSTTRIKAFGHLTNFFVPASAHNSCFDSHFLPLPFFV
jgi:hypothetical protein